jgi:hypothetical protein
MEIQKINVTTTHLCYVMLWNFVYGMVQGVWHIERNKKKIIKLGCLFVMINVTYSNAGHQDRLGRCLWLDFERYAKALFQVSQELYTVG